MKCPNHDSNYLISLYHKQALTRWLALSRTLRPNSKLEYRQTFNVTPLCTFQYSLVNKLNLTIGCQRGRGLKREFVFLKMECPNCPRKTQTLHRLSLAGRVPPGRRSAQPEGRDPVSPLKSKSGRRKDCLSPLFPNPDFCLRRSYNKALVVVCYRRYPNPLPPLK